jgi:hypothetical protein
VSRTLRQDDICPFDAAAVPNGLAAAPVNPEDQATAELWAAIALEFLELVGRSNEQRVVVFPRCGVPKYDEKLHSATDCARPARCGRDFEQVG